VESTPSGGIVSEVPEAFLLTGWTWDASGPTSAVGWRSPVGPKAAETATWLRSASAWSAPVSVPSSPLDQSSSAARASGTAIQLQLLGNGQLGMLRYVPGQGWGAPLAFGGPDEQGVVAIGPQDEAMLVSPVGWRTFTAANGWSALRAWPFPTGAVFVPQALQVDGAGNFYVAALRCALPKDPKSCEPVVAKYAPATGWEDPSPIAPGAGFVGINLHVSPGGHLVAWYFVSDGLLIPSRVELRAVVRQPGGAWSPQALLAPMQEEFWASASFVAQDSGRVIGAWNFGYGQVEGTDYSPRAGWSGPQIIQQGPRAITAGRIGVVLDRDVPTAVWAIGPAAATSTSFYQSRFR
jgi:hypothetical protein